MLVQTTATIIRDGGSQGTAGSEPTPTQLVSLRITPNWLSVEPGKPVEFDCVLKCDNKTICNPPPRITWSARTGAINPQAAIVGGMLRIPAAAAEDEKYYTCQAESDSVSLSVRTVVLVRKKCE